MSRSGYSEDCYGWELIMWRGAVKSAIRGKRGQNMLGELAAALDAMPEKRLIRNKLIETDGEVCAMGCLARARSIDVSQIDPYEPDEVAAAFGVAPALAQEIAFINDDWGYGETPEQRWKTVREWVRSKLSLSPDVAGPTASLSAAKAETSLGDSTTSPHSDR